MTKEIAFLNDCDYSSFQLSLNTPRAQHHSLRPNDLRKERTIVEATTTGSASEALIMPFATKCLYILANDGLPALLTLGSSSFRAFSLTADTPSIAILFYV